MHDGKICVGLVGIGWAGRMHARALNHVYNVNVRLKTLCALEPAVADVAKQFNFENWTHDYNDLLKDEEIDVIDIVTPPNMHKDMIISAMRAGKHVICEKPLTGYFGEPDDVEPIGQVSKEKMLRSARKSMDEIEAVIKETGKKFCYSANWVYSPAFIRACELIKAKGTTVMQMQGYCRHKGSPAPYVKYWSKSGGGTLARNVVHPLSAALYLKKMEMESKGLTFGVKSVECDCSQITKNVETRYIEASPVDTEDWAMAIFTFTDGTKAIVSAADTFIGECANKFEIFGNDAVLACNFSPNNLLEGYFSDEVGIENEYIVEKGDNNMGHRLIPVAEETVRGYYGEMQDFMECIRDDREPRVGFEIARAATELVQVAYCAAEQGRRVEIADFCK